MDTEGGFVFPEVRPGLYLKKFQIVRHDIAARRRAKAPRSSQEEAYHLASAEKRDRIIFFVSKTRFSKGFYFLNEGTARIGLLRVRRVHRPQRRAERGLVPTQDTNK